MASGDPEDWTLEEEAYTHYLGKLFAEEYTEDFNDYQAAKRLGASDKIAKKLGYKIRQHPITQEYIAEIINNFEVRNNVSRDKILSLLYRDATNFNVFAKPSARVSAQKKLADVLGMVVDKKEINFKDKVPVINMSVVKSE